MPLAWLVPVFVTYVEILAHYCSLQDQTLEGSLPVMLKNIPCSMSMVNFHSYTNTATAAVETVSDEVQSFCFTATKLQVGFRNEQLPCCVVCIVMFLVEN